MSIPIVSASDVLAKRGKGGKKGGPRYQKYTDALKPHLSFIEETIENDADGIARIRLEDLADACGMQMKTIKNGEVDQTSGGLDPTSLGWGLKYALFQAGYAFTQGTVGDNKDPVLLIRRKTEKDVLPKSLQAKTDAGMTGVGAAGAGVEA